MLKPVDSAAQGPMRCSRGNLRACSHASSRTTSRRPALVIRSTSSHTDLHSSLLSAQDTTQAQQAPPAPDAVTTGKPQQAAGAHFSSRRPPVVAAATFLPARSSNLALQAAAQRPPLALLNDAVRAFRCQIIAQSMSHHSSSSGASGSSTRTTSAGAPTTRGGASTGGGDGGGHMAGSGSGGKGGRSVNTRGGSGGSMDEHDGGPFADDVDEAEDDACSWPPDLPATLPPLLGAAPPTFDERPEAVIGKGGCATVYAWSAPPAGTTQQQQQARWPAQATPATAAAVAALTSGCSVAIATPLSGDAPSSSSSPSAPHVVIPSSSSTVVCAPARSPAPTPAASAAAPASKSNAEAWRWSDVPGEWAVKCDPVSYRHAGHLGECDLDRLGDLLPALLPPHPNVLAPQAWWVSELTQQPTPSATSAPAAAAPEPHTAGSSTPQQQQQGGFKLFTLYRRFECSLWELLDRINALAMAAGEQRGEEAWRVRPRLGVRSLLRVVRDVAAALEHLHAHRVLHADLKPENLLLVLDPQHGRGGALEERRHPAVAQAVLIDFGLARLLPPDMQQLDSKGGTWMYKAPEQMTGPPGMRLAGQERTLVPQVCLESDLWSLGALICWLARDGELRTRSGLPFGQPDDQVAKWGDRPNGRGSQEAFYMLWEDILPPVPAADDAAAAEEEEHEGQEERARVMVLLRRLAQGLMRTEPSQRTPAAQVRVAAAQALLELEQHRSGSPAAAASSATSPSGAQASRPARSGNGRSA